MDLDTPDTRPVSRVVPYAGVAFGAIVVVTIALLLAMPQRYFPTTIHDRLLSGLAARGTTAAQARATLDGIRARELAALAANGLPARDAIAGSIEHGHDKGGYWATQTIAVPADDYPRFARLANRINRLKDPDFGLSFPQAPFQTALILLLVIAFAIGSVSVVALETRKADVDRAPKGMHPAIVATQTLTYGIIAAIAIFYAHLLGDGIAGAFIAIEAIFILSLAMWLYQTRRSWTQPTGYRIAWYAYIAALIACTIAVAITAAQPVI